MPRSYAPRIPKNINEIIDLLGSMMLSAPGFKDQTGYFPERNIDSEFHILNEGFKAARAKLGDDPYFALVALSDRARAHFAADPEDGSGDAAKGRQLIVEMEDILRRAGGGAKR